MKRCGKVKNPCKICFESVSKKQGLQCQGACQKWAHFKCLNYTPGKIQDIKAKIIKIACPCPDCNTSEPKEVLTDPPYSCTNIQCPANKLPVCTSTECPSKDSPIPSYPSPPLECTPESPPVTSPKYQHRQTSPRPTNTLLPPKCNIPPPLSLVKRANNASQCSPCPSKSKKHAKKCFSPKQSKSCSTISDTSYDSVFYSRPGERPGNNNATMYVVKHSKLQTQSGKQSPAMCSASSDSKLSAADHRMLFSAIENLCNTVGQLSNQLKELMCKMKTMGAQ